MLFSSISENSNLINYVNHLSQIPKQNVLPQLDISNLLKERLCNSILFYFFPNIQSRK